MVNGSFTILKQITILKCDIKYIYSVTLMSSTGHPGQRLEFYFNSNFLGRAPLHPNDSLIVRMTLLMLLRLPGFSKES